jgi:hypothetical protein
MAWKRGIVRADEREADLDPTTTGSLPPAAPRNADADADADAAAPTPSIMQDYELVDVAEDAAVVQGPAGMRRVRVGAVLPGVGRITAIQRVAGEWVIVRSASTICARR